VEAARSLQRFASFELAANWLGSPQHAVIVQ